MLSDASFSAPTTSAVPLKRASAPAEELEHRPDLCAKRELVAEERVVTLAAADVRASRALPGGPFGSRARRASGMTTTGPALAGRRRLRQRSPCVLQSTIRGLARRARSTAALTSALAGWLALTSALAGWSALTSALAGWLLHGLPDAVHQIGWKIRVWGLCLIDHVFRLPSEELTPGECVQTRARRREEDPAGRADDASGSTASGAVGEEAIPAERRTTCCSVGDVSESHSEVDHLVRQRLAPVVTRLLPVRSHLDSVPVKSMICSGTTCEYQPSLNLLQFPRSVCQGFPTAICAKHGPSRWSAAPQWRAAPGGRPSRVPSPGCSGVAGAASRSCVSPTIRLLMSTSP